MFKKLFERLRRGGQPADPSTETGTELTLEDLVKLSKLAEPDGPPPRRHHYAFAHQLMPMLMSTNVKQFATILASPAAQRFAEDMWDRLASDQTVDVVLPREGLSTSVHEFDDYVICLITMPPPQFTTEAYFAALVCPRTDDDLKPDITPDEWGARYFVLENGFVYSTEPPRTVLGEWSSSGHANYGTGPEPNVGDFLAAIHDMMLKSTPPAPQ